MECGARIEPGVDRAFSLDATDELAWCAGAAAEGIEVASDDEFFPSGCSAIV